jgi:hypothetical protein
MARAACSRAVEFAGWQFDMTHCDYGGDRVLYITTASAGYAVFNAACGKVTKFMQHSSLVSTLTV